MMPELGKYAFAVLASYGSSIALIAVIVWASLRRARRIRVELEQVEARRNGES